LLGKLLGAAEDGIITAFVDGTATIDDE